MTKLANCTVVITGTLSIPRASAQKLLRRAGARFQNAVTSKTDYLVVGDEPGRTKRRRARELGVETLTERQLANRLRGVRLLASDIPAKKLGANGPVWPLAVAEREFAIALRLGNWNEASYWKAHLAVSKSFYGRRTGR